MLITLIRNGQTQGEREGRHIGRTDEPLCEEGIANILERASRGAYPLAEAVYSSPMLRAQGTAELIYPELTPILNEGLRACDLGGFERLDNAGLHAHPGYRAWRETGACPDGEDRAEFARRSVESFCRAVDESFEANLHRISLVMHAAALMAVLERCAIPRKGFYAWQAEYGDGFLLTAERASWERERSLRVLRRLGKA